MAVKYWVYGGLVAIGVVGLATQAPWHRLFGPKTAASFVASGGLEDDRILMPSQQFRTPDGNASGWYVMAGSNLAGVAGTNVSRAFSDTVRALSGGRLIFFRRGPNGTAVVTRPDGAWWVFDTNWNGLSKHELQRLARDETLGGPQIDVKPYLRASGVYVLPEKALLDLATVDFSVCGTCSSLDFVEVYRVAKGEDRADGKDFLHYGKRQLFNGLAPAKFRYLAQ